MEVSQSRILIVDDDRHSLSVIEKSLKLSNANLVTALSGKQALAQLDGSFAVIILDINLDDSNGFEIAEKIRSRVDTVVTPIIFISASTDPAYVERAYACGGTAYISKPFDPAVLLGKVNYFVKLFAQIKKQSREEIRARSLAESERSQLLENSLDAVIGVGADELVFYWNRYAEHIFGWTNEEALGKSMAELIVPELFRGAHREGMLRFIKTGESKIQNRRIEVPALHKNGSQFTIELTITSMKTAESSYRFYSFIRDITDRIDARRAADEVRAAKEDAERANALKSAFLANMSHEIRTPLGAMLGFADLLRNPETTPAERTGFIDIISRNGEALSVIINDILDLSKVEAGHLTLDYDRTDVREIIEDVLSLLRVKANEKGLTLSHACEAAHDQLVITADPLRVRQILVNLVGNAIKFTQFGSVTLKSSVRQSLSERKVVVQIEDTGIGIASSVLPRIFQTFVQADGTMTRRFGGTGLGLALSKKLAVAMGGDITILRSEEGRGSTFQIVIPDSPGHGSQVRLALAADTSEMEVGELALEKMKILIVDDAFDNQNLIARYLKKRGAEVEIATNGFEGLQAALRGAHDLVLMDIQMPVMDGYTATQRLRDSGFKKPIIAITAHAMSDIRRKALNVGYTDHITKPINELSLIRSILKHR